MSFDAPSNSGCPASPEYQDVIDFAARNTYNPELLGDINELKHKYNCTIKSPSDAVDMAVQALRAADPSISAHHEPGGLYGPARAGIGAGLDLKSGKLKLTKVIPGGPAIAGDLKVGDKITSIDGKPITLKTTAEDVHQLLVAKKYSLDGSIGIGMTRDANGTAKISQVEPKSAAEAAGLMEGDKILAVDGNPSSSKESLIDLNKRIEGRDGSKVHLLIERDSTRVGINLIRRSDGYPAVGLTVERDGKTFDMTVPRRPVEVQTVRAIHGNEQLTPGGQTLPPDTTYIKVDDFFNVDTTDKIWKALQEHHEKNQTVDSADKKSTQAGSVILDLRDNLGGRSDDAVLTSSLFMTKGDVYKHNSRIVSDPSTPQYKMETVSVNESSVSHNGTTGDTSPQTSFTGDRMPLTSQPEQLIVLVNDKTTGTAELLAESLKVNAGATVIGTETRGYGVTQLAHQVKRDTMLLIPSGRLMTPTGRWLGNGTTVRNGVAPTVRVENKKDAEFGSDKDEQVRAAIKVIRDQADKKN